MKAAEAAGEGTPPVDKSTALQSVLMPLSDSDNEAVKPQLSRTLRHPQASIFLALSFGSFLLPTDSEKPRKVGFLNQATSRPNPQLAESRSSSGHLEASKVGVNKYVTEHDRYRLHEACFTGGY